MKDQRQVSAPAKRRDGNAMGTWEILRCPEMEVRELELSLELGGQRLSIFSSSRKRKGDGAGGGPRPLVGAEEGRESSSCSPQCGRKERAVCRLRENR
jgi:hypothetical protein